MSIMSVPKAYLSQSTTYIQPDEQISCHINITCPYYRDVKLLL